MENLFDDLGYVYKHYQSVANLMELDDDSAKEDYAVLKDDLFRVLADVVPYYANGYKECDALISDVYIHLFSICKKGDNTGLTKLDVLFVKATDNTMLNSSIKKTIINYTYSEYRKNSKRDLKNIALTEISEDGDEIDNLALNGIYTDEDYDGNLLMQDLIEHLLKKSFHKKQHKDLIHIYIILSKLYSIYKGDKFDKRGLFKHLSETSRKDILKETNTILEMFNFSIIEDSKDIFVNTSNYHLRYCAEDLYNAYLEDSKKLFSL